MKRHRQKKRTARKRVLILCEGETERNYFQAIKEDPDYKQALSAIQAQIVAAKNPTPEHVVSEALKRAKREASQGNPYDQVWVVFDHDHHAHRNVAYVKAERAKCGIGFSAIAFEMWYLLHFVKSARPFSNGDELIAVLKKHYPNYEKAQQNDFLNLKDKLTDAIENAEWLRKQVFQEHESIPNHNPWTDVDRLVLELTKNLSQ